MISDMQEVQDEHTCLSIWRGTYSIIDVYICWYTAKNISFLFNWKGSRAPNIFPSWPHLLSELPVFFLSSLIYLPKSEIINCSMQVAHSTEPSSDQYNFGFRLPVFEQAPCGHSGNLSL
jgi:hypothetical protein